MLGVSGVTGYSTSPSISVSRDDRRRQQPPGRRPRRRGPDIVQRQGVPRSQKGKGFDAAKGAPGETMEKEDWFIYFNKNQTKHTREGTQKDTHKTQKTTLKGAPTGLLTLYRQTHA